MKRQKIKSNGYSLVEVIIAMAMVGILAIAFLSIFTSGFRSIAKSGDRAVAAYDSQKVLSSKVVDTEELEDADYTEQTVTFKFKDGPSIDIEVLLIDTEVDVNGSKTNMNGFVTAP